MASSSNLKQPALGAVENGQPVVTYSLSKDGIGLVKFNRPHANNAVHDWVYLEFMKALDEAEANDACKIVVVTGEGRFFCSGADLGAGFDSSVGPLKSYNLKKNALTTEQKLCEGTGSYYDPVGRFMLRMINFPKVIVAAVNGPAIGVGATILPHCDIIYAREKGVYFWTPFTQLSVCPEFCSSYTFPKILGASLAAEVLYLGKRLSVEESLRSGFISDIIKADSAEGFLEQVFKRLRGSINAPNSLRSLTLFKRLSRDQAELDHLRSVHLKEMKLLDERSIGPDSESAQALKVMLSAGSKKKKAKL